MQNLSIIANVSKNRGLGHGGELLWRIPEDMKFFRATTTNHCVVMGRKTYESIGRPLPNRENIVLTRGSLTSSNSADTESPRSSSDDKTHSELPDIKICRNLATLDQLLETTPGEKFIIGGATLYNIYIDRADKLYLTEVDAMKPADTFFPEFDRSGFDRRVLQTGEYEGIKYEIVEYTRKP